MAAKTFALKIQEPCQQSWDEMSPMNNGKFCESCNKVVIDFTSMSNEGIAEFFKNPNQKICGQFRKSQLENTFTFVYKSPWSFNKTFLKFSLASVLTFAGLKGFSQTTKKDDSGKNAIPNSTVKTDSVSVTITPPEKHEIMVLGGPMYVETEKVELVKPNKVLAVRFIENNTGKAIKNGSVFIDKAQKTFYAKDNGSINLSIPDSLTNVETGIYYSAPGYETVYRTIGFKKQGNTPVIIKMIKEEMIMKGQVIKMPNPPKKTNCTK
ncbi:MAG: hypothetical protein IAF38_16540 [Bacteroidia bacterium]|nr:hypothetical protein [Bacteroidia bacterium]